MSVDLKIDEKWIQAIVTAEMQAALVRALGGDVYDKTVKQIVQNALTQRIDRDGRPSNYDRDPTFIQKTLSEEIQRMTQAALVAMLTERRADIEEMIRQQLNQRKGDIASQFIDSLVDGTKDRWKLNIGLSFAKSD